MYTMEIDVAYIVHGIGRCGIGKSDLCLLNTSNTSENECRLQVVELHKF